MLLGEKMFNIVKMYMNNLKIENLDQMAKNNNIFLSEDELKFSYNFIKKNWESYLNNPSSLNMDKYKSFYSDENFIKIKKLYAIMFNKYSRFL